VVVGGTLYSILHNTYLDTSNPLLTHLPHPSHKHSYFASKKNILNQLFVKQAWYWTSAAFWAVWFTANEQGVVGGVRTVDAAGRWLTTTAVFGLFASWFFGPSLFARLLSISGGECVIYVPPPPGVEEPHVIQVPSSFCAYRTTVTPETHPSLFSQPPFASFSAEGFATDFKAVPKLYKGHDVSGHVFLLTLSVLFLVDALVRARRGKPSLESNVAQAAAWSLVGLWVVMLGATAVYFHTWEEKASAFVIALVAHAIAQYPFQVQRRDVPE